MRTFFSAVLAVILSACSGIVAARADEASLGQWSPVYSLPLVPSSGALLPNGKVLLWSADGEYGWTDDGVGVHTTTFDPATGQNVPKSFGINHNMFCTGTTQLPDGRILVNGGNQSKATSIYDPETGSFKLVQQMNIARGYSGNTILQDGTVLTFGGSWRPQIYGNRIAEVWTEGSGWRVLDNLLPGPMEVYDKRDRFAADSHFWLQPAGNGRVFFAGPSPKLHWLDTVGSGAATAVGTRGDDVHSINGTAVMYDAGRIFKAGGAKQYQGVPANASAYAIDIRKGVSVTKLSPMIYQRTYVNGVVLPDGRVMLVGGAHYAETGTDANAVLANEIWDPATGLFSPVPPLAVPRVYHSIALLLPDGRVLAGGGGLCGDCGANHPDVQVYSPAYLFNPDGTPASRPAIEDAPEQLRYGTKATVTASGEITQFSLVRFGAATHTVDNDQRRLKLSFRKTGTDTYEVAVPSNPGWLLPGHWMLFAIDAKGTPSVARIVQVPLNDVARLRAPMTVIGNLQDRIDIPVEAAALDGPVTLSAQGLPAGLAIDPSTGHISGVPGETGTFLVAVEARRDDMTVSTEFTLTIGPKLANRTPAIQPIAAESAVVGIAKAISVTASDPDGDVLTFSASGLPPGMAIDPTSGIISGTPSAGGSYSATVTVKDPDGLSASTGSAWTVTLPPMPRVVSLTIPKATAGVRVNYSPDIANQSGAGFKWDFGDGTVETAFTEKPNRSHTFMQAGSYRVVLTLLSIDGRTAEYAFDQTVSPATQPNTAPSVASIAARTATVGTATTLTVSASDPEGDTLTFTAANLPPGLAINAATGVISGTPTAAGSFAATVTATDPGGLSGSASIAWTVNLPPMPTVTDLAAPPVDAGTVASYKPTIANGSGASYRWTFGDGSATTPWSASPDANHLFAAAGTYTVELGLKSVDGRTGRYTFDQVVSPVPAKNEPPVVTKPSDQISVAGGIGELDVVAFDPEGETLSFAATGLPPGLVISPSSGGVSGSPTTAGNYTVRATVSDPRGGQTTVAFAWSVLSADLPTVSNLVVRPAKVGAAVTYAPTVARAADATFRWDFGDGSPPTAFAPSPSATHVFDRPGIFRLILTAKLPDGRTTTHFADQAVVPAGQVWAVAGATSGMARERRGALERIWVVNADNNSVAVLDARTQARLKEIPVGRGPESVAVAPGGWIWVVNRDSSTISVVSPASLSVTRTIALPFASRPFDLVFLPDGTAVVSLEGRQQLAYLSPAGALLRRVAVGPAVRHLALDRRRGQLLASRFITPPLPGESTARVLTPPNRGGEVLALASTGKLAARYVLAHRDGVDSQLSGRGIPNYLGASAVSPDGLSAWVPSKQDNVKRGTLRDGRNLNFQNTVRAAISRIDLGSRAEDRAARIDLDNSGIASAALFHPSGAWLFVALQTSREVAVVDPAGRRQLFRFPVGRAPSALALSADGLTLFVSNFTDRTVSVVDLRPLVLHGKREVETVALVRTIARERLNPQVLRGKQLFYDAADPRLARDAYLSCAVCHDRGEGDGRVWDMTGFGEGLRNTSVLLGRAGMGEGRLHWSGNFDEVQDFEGQIRTLSGGDGLLADSLFLAGTRRHPLGLPKAGLSADLDALAAYVTSLRRAPVSPYALSQSPLRLTYAGQLGRTLYTNLGCGSCHNVDGKISPLRNIGTITAASGSRLGQKLTGIDPPTLKGVFATAPYLHDGSARTVEDAIRRHRNLELGAAAISRLAAFVRQL